MSFETWAAFAVASAIMLAIPGPTILLVVSYALSHGRRVAFATVAGVALGDITALTASMLGLGALLATSATLFTVLKWVGAAYLVYLGIKLWRAPMSQQALPEATQEAGVRRIFLHAYVITALNPKSIIFFIAFLPQFYNPSAPGLTQFVVLEVTFVVLATLNAAVYAVLASRARGMIRKPSVQRIVNRTGGSLLMAAGLLAVSWRSASA